MKRDDQEKRRQRIADFRLGVITELIHTRASPAELARLIAEKAARTWEIPCSRKTSLTASCIRKWLAAFKARGRDGLVPRQRRDAGKSRAIDDRLKELILARLEKKPELSASVVVRSLQREGVLDRDISRSSLSRFIIAQGVERGERLRRQTKDQVLRYVFEYPLDCVQADAMHSFAVPDHDGKMRKAILIAFIDDATRRIVYSAFSFSENAFQFERGILHILRAHGRIRRLYTDNGAAFVSTQTRRILDTLGIPLIHSRPGMPKGRGKIERFFRTVRMQFEATVEPASVKSIQDYDMRFRSWLEREYHRNPHSGLAGSTPLDAWCAKSAHILHVDQTIDLQDVFQHEEVRSVSNDATVQVNGIRYEVPSLLIGRKIKLRVDPHAAVLSVRIFFDGKDYGTARRVDVHGNAHARRIMSGDDPALLALRAGTTQGWSRPAGAARPCNPGWSRPAGAARPCNPGGEK